MDWLREQINDTKNVIVSCSQDFAMSFEPIGTWVKTIPIRAIVAIALFGLVVISLGVWYLLAHCILLFFMTVEYLKSKVFELMGRK